MIVGIAPDRAPLRKYSSPHLQQIKLRELAANLESRGVKIVQIGDTAIRVNLRGLLQASGTLQQAQVAMMEILRELGADSVNIEPEDVEYLTGRDVFSQAIARGLESGIPQLEAILQDVPITEDGSDDVVPIFDRLDRAAHFIATDRHPDHEIEARLKHGAANDLVNAGLLQPGAGYDDWMQVREELPPALPREFQTEARPYRSIFDRSDD